MTIIKKINTHYFDIVIVGAGGAGLMAALHSAKRGMKTACISKVDPTRSHTVAAKGGINAALGNVTKDDWRWHWYDTVRGGDWLGDQDAIQFMCRNAASTIIELEQMGVPFSRDKNGKIFQRIYGGQSSNFGKGKAPHRACAAADRTGHAILHTLYQQSLKHKAKFFIDHFALELIMDDGVCRGIISWDMASGEINIFRSHMVILATGGYGQSFETNTSSSICTGDGNAMALRAGIPLQDMEFVQFHPTGLHGSGFLITEAARSEGGYLINARGERFMERYAPEYKDLAARDVISRAMATEIFEGRGVGDKKDHLLLCLQHLPEYDIKKKLPTVYENTKTFAKIDPTRTPIPVVPSVHYTMGGIGTNKHCEVLNENDEAVQGLMAIGETACMSIHGANRLGCNSLLDIIVFGKAAIERAHEVVPKNSTHKQIGMDADEAIGRLSEILNHKGNNSTYAVRRDLKRTMANNVGVFRNGELLQNGAKRISNIQKCLGDITINDNSLVWNNELLEYLELENLVLQGKITLESALRRNESRGSHLRQDFPNRNDNKWLKHSIVYFKNGNIEYKTRKIRMQTGNNNLPSLEPEKRAY